MGELHFENTFKCQLNGYTCTEGDGIECCEGREVETRRCVPCDETIHKKPLQTIYTTAGRCDFEVANNTGIQVNKYVLIYLGILM